MGVVYGAGSLWQWRLHAEEPGHSEFFLAPGAGWREAIDFEGSTYVGLLGKILDGVPTTDMVPDWTRTISGRALSTADGGLIVYRENGGPVMVFDDTVPLGYTHRRPARRVGRRDRQTRHSDVSDPGRGWSAPRLPVSS